LSAKQQIEGVRLGLDIGKARDGADARRTQANKPQPTGE